MLTESLTQPTGLLFNQLFGGGPLQDAMKLSIHSDYGFNAYLQSFRISEDDLSGTVLDIGSGKFELFSKGAAARGIKVISLNPRLVDEMQREWVKRPVEGIEWQERSVAALAQNLPFQDESFDTIVSHYSIPMWILEEEGVITALREIVRVLKPGGKAYLGPPASIGQIEFIKGLDLGNNIYIRLEDHPLEGKDFIIKIDKTIAPPEVPTELDPKKF